MPRAGAASHKSWLGPRIGWTGGESAQQGQVKKHFRAQGMTDLRFYHRAGPFPLGEIAARIGAEMDNSAAAAFPIHDVASLEGAEPGEISLYSDAKYARAFARPRASVVITDHKLRTHEHNGTSLLLSPNPRLAFAQVGHLFYPPAERIDGVAAPVPV